MWGIFGSRNISSHMEHRYENETLNIFFLKICTALRAEGGGGDLNILETRTAFFFNKGCW
jgi:hypothetical protein